MTTLISCQYNLPDLILMAHSMQRLQLLLPYLEDLLLTARALQPDSCPVLHETLALLGEAHEKPELQHMQPLIARMLKVWSFRPHNWDGCLNIWVDKAPCIKSNEMLEVEYCHYGKGMIMPDCGQLDQPRPHLWVSSFAALQLSAATLPSTAPSAAPMKAPATSTALICHSSQVKVSLCLMLAKCF